MNISEEMKGLNLSFGYVEMKDQAKFPRNVDKWQRFGSKKASDLELLNWCRYEVTGVCLFTGEISQIIDVDSKNWKREGSFNEIFLQRLKYISFYDKLVYYKTINNGLQLPYKCSKVEGNKKLAIVDNECLIETRGSGGLAVCPPTVGYEWLDGGEWLAVPTLTPDERDELIELCMDFNEQIEPEFIKNNPVSSNINLGKAGDDWADKTDFIEWIKTHDWKVDRIVNDGTVLLRRPEKEQGASASWNYKGLGRFYCWSSSVDLPLEKLLKPFAVKAYIEHNGNFKQCARALRSQGFGNDIVTIIEMCEHCKNWGELALLLKEYKESIIKLDEDQYETLKFTIESMNIKGVSSNKIDTLKKNMLKRDESIVKSWNDELLYLDNGRTSCSLFNIQKILGNDKRYKDIFKYDEFRQRMVYVNQDKFYEFDDDNAVRLRNQLSEKYGDFKEGDIIDAVKYISIQNVFHPIQDLIKSVEWDCKARVDKWLTTYAGVKDCEYSRIVGKVWLIGSVARIFNAGVKFDTMLVLEGEQGAKKSSLLRELCFDNFLDGMTDLNNKDSLMQLFGKWIVEFSELEGMSGKKAETVKAFLARNEDSIRLPYARTDKIYKRSCVFAGTTNDEQYLHDTTGNRRFLPVMVGEIDLKSLIEDRAQLWAEVYQMYRNGEKWWFDKGTNEYKLCEIEQKKRIKQDDVFSELKEWLICNHSINGIVQIRGLEVWEGFDEGRKKDFNRQKQLEISHRLLKMGLKRGSFRQEKTVVKGFLGEIW